MVLKAGLLRAHAAIKSRLYRNRVALGVTYDTAVCFLEAASSGRDLLYLNLAASYAAKSRLCRRTNAETAVAVDTRPCIHDTLHKSPTRRLATWAWSLRDTRPGFATDTSRRISTQAAALSVASALNVFIPPYLSSFSCTSRACPGASWHSSPQ